MCSTNGYTPAWMNSSVPDRARTRQPHAVLDLPSRRLKGRKIAALLDLPAGPARLLEVGTGSGGIAHYLGTELQLQLQVESVDIVDTRLLREGYGFRRVEGVELPFPDQSFDLVLSNHVIEHVGDRETQLGHLRELRRVLRPQGRGYLAVPNRWMWVEPHYRLAGLSWLPPRLRSPYLRLRRRGEWYDCRPLSCRQLERLLDAAGLAYHRASIQALHETLRLESGHGFARRLIDILPSATLQRLAPLSPTLIYLLQR